MLRCGRKVFNISSVLSLCVCVVFRDGPLMTGASLLPLNTFIVHPGGRQGETEQPRPESGQEPEVEAGARGQGAEALRPCPQQLLSLRH